MTWLNLSQYARQRGCSSEAVKQAILGGRLKNGARQKPNGKYEVNPEIANLEWALNTRHEKRFNVKDPTQKYRSDTPKEPHLKEGVDRSPLPNELADTMAQASLMKEQYAAKLTKLKFEIESGKYVEAEDVKKEGFKLARTVRDSLMNIPDRVAAEFAGIQNAAEIHMRLADEIRNCLELLQDGETE